MLNKRERKTFRVRALQTLSYQSCADTPGSEKKKVSKKNHICETLDLAKRKDSQERCLLWHRVELFILCLVSGLVIVGKGSHRQGDKNKWA